MALKERFTNGVASANLWGLEMARQAARTGLKGRDLGVPQLREVRGFDIAGPGGPIPCRLYVPENAEAPGPLLVFFHGGGFVIGDLETHDALCRQLAEFSGLRILASAYRLAPEHPYPAQMEDALAVASWVQAHSAEVGADPARLGVGGDSAGGYLAIATASRMPQVFKAQILIYPLLHLEDDLWSDSMTRNGRIIGRLAVRYIENQLAFTEARAPSLLRDDGLVALPTLIAVGNGLDPCAPDAEPFAARLRQMGADVILKAYPGLVHGFANLTHLSNGAKLAVREIGESAGALLRA